MGAIVALYATLGAVLPFLALWHGWRSGWRSETRTAGLWAHDPQPPMDEWTAQRYASGGW